MNFGLSEVLEAASGLFLNLVLVLEQSRIEGLPDYSIDLWHADYFLFVLRTLTQTSHFDLSVSE